jgi:chemotaxis protein MotB
MGRRKKRIGGGDEGAPEWLTTYSDMVTLLLTFFVLLFSMATIDKQKFEDLAHALRSSYIHRSSGDMLRSNMGKSILTVNFVNPDDTGEKRVDNKRYIEASEEIILDDTEIIEGKKLEKAKEQLEIDVEKLGISDLVEIIDERDYLLIRLNSQVLFESGSAEILSEGKRTLDALGKPLIPLENEILIQGHTDNVPINTPLFPSNWELSTKRATNVVVYLIESLNLDPSKLTATGNGEYRPIGDNNTAEGRQKNRRIEIMILKK